MLHFVTPVSRVLKKNTRLAISNINNASIIQPATEINMKSINFDHISANPLLPEVKEAMIEAINKGLP